MHTITVHSPTLSDLRYAHADLKQRSQEEGLYLGGDNPVQITFARPVALPSNTYRESIRTQFDLDLYFITNEVRFRKTRRQHFTIPEHTYAAITQLAVRTKDDWINHQFRELQRIQTLFLPTIWTHWQEQIAADPEPYMQFEWTRYALRQSHFNDPVREQMARMVQDPATFTPARLEAVRFRSAHLFTLGWQDQTQQFTAEFSSIRSNGQFHGRYQVVNESTAVRAQRTTFLNKVFDETPL